MSGPSQALWLAHVQLLDSALPIGSFAHSYGLETLVQRGRVTTPQELKSYCRTTLHGTWAPSDALCVAAVFRWRASERVEELWRLDEAMHAARLAEETREGMRKTGRRLQQLGEAMHPHLDWAPLREAVQSEQCPGTFPLIYGWVCSEIGFDETTAVHGYLYSSLNTTVTNAVRLMRLGQTDGQSILATLLNEIPSAWDAVKDRDPWDFCTALPELEIAQMGHEQLYSRLFMS